MALEADFIKPQNSPILSLFNMLLEIGKTKNETFDLFGFQD
jgi:hypothetical protein